MCFHKSFVGVGILCLSAVLGCDNSPSSDRPSGPNPAGDANSAARSVPLAPTKPSPEQIAKWRIPDYDNFQLLTCADGFGDPAVLCMAISPDGKQFALGGAKLTLWNTYDAKSSVDFLSRYQHDEVERPLRSVAISSNGEWLAAGDQNGKVRIWTIGDQSEVLAISAHPGHISQVAFSPNCRLLATTSYSGEVKIWQLPDGELLKSLKIGSQEIARLEFLSDRLLASAGSEVSVWNIESGQKDAALTSAYVRAPALGLSSDRRILAWNDANSVVRFWDVPASKEVDVTLQGAGAKLVEFSPDGKWIATYSQDSTIRIWHAATGTVVQVIDADGGSTSALKWLPNSNALLIASAVGRVRIWGEHKAAQQIGFEQIQLPKLATFAGGLKSLSSAQLQQVADIRSFPRLPAALPQWSDFGSSGYTAHVPQTEAESFYRYTLTKAGWVETGRSDASQSGLSFRKAACELSVSFAPSAAADATAGDLQINLQFAGNYDVRKLPQFKPINSKSSWESFSSVSYRTNSELTDVEVGLLKQLHSAGWTAYTRLAAAGNEEPNTRNITLLQGGSELNVSLGYPADSTTEAVVQLSVAVTNKSVPIPPDAGWIEFDNSTDLQFVINTKMDLQQTIEFFDTRLAAEGWLPRPSGRQVKDTQGWLPFIRGQQDLYLRLSALPSGGTRIVAGDAASSSWQLQVPIEPREQQTQDGLEAADFRLPTDASEVKYDVDQKRIEFAVPGATPVKLAEQFVTQMESLDWTREQAGVMSDEYVLITFTKAKAEIQLRARAAANKATAMLSGDGILWAKPLPTAPVRISYEAWLRRGRRAATLDLLDEFSAEMHRIPVGGKSK